MKIENSTLEDLKNILSLYASAIAYQKEKKGLPWPNLDREMIEKEIIEKRQWKLTINGTIACIWVTTFDDPEIWGEKNNQPSIYLHRIATDPVFRGLNVIAKVFDWTKTFARVNQKNYIRLDIASINPGLITMYVRNGFKFIGMNKMGVSESLPAHYNNATVCLFEMKLN
ncbi:GNAT family N-acetyltransferase [Sinomicrobium pectinilyticum]|uniref:GNAT family N-acetyltransferase n=1 Tax=Sinomicrobium pectinilyticum TaxID=1084421 RepID=A0A3N0F3I0_SINP1|nr:GNAT family N-acetyltransferase [Sinomicrobium pectinilyticum]RNL94537.1 GNAT family N-acetyltransferase [Sinomicrobium pectinilyticum]